MKKINTIVICLFSILIGIVIGYFLFNNKNGNTNNSTEKSVNLLESIEGVWFESSGLGVVIEEQKSQYTFNFIQDSTGATPAGLIKNIINKGNNKYEIEVFYEAYDGEMTSRPERTTHHNIDISNIKNNQITVDNETFDYISETWDYTKIEAYMKK